jgi:uncharacterized membrane protein
MSEMPPTVPPAVPPPSGGSYTPPPPPGGGSYTPPPPPGGGSYTPPPPSGTSSSSDRTIMLVLSYLGLLALIPLLTKKDDPEVQWHAKNGLAIMVAWFVLWFVFMIIGFAPLGPLHLVLAAIRCLISLGYLALIIICIMKAVNGQRFRVPVISDFADKM